jgi:Putative MetA-pathway of phenol degradation
MAACNGAAYGQNAPSSDSAAKENSPKTIAEWLFGSRNSSQTRPKEDDRIEPDRPHFPEATTTVGLGRAVLESGYTFTSNGSSFRSHSLPEALLRVGIFAEWFEFRVGQSFLAQRQMAGGTAIESSGAQDLYLGMKLALSEQKGIWPQVALIPQMTVPTGSSAVSAGRILPGLNIDASWEVIKELFDIEFLVANNAVQDGPRNSRLEIATGLTGAVHLTKQLEAFAEWDAFYPIGGLGPAPPRHYAVGGLVYFVNSNFAADIRAGRGLNGNSNDWLFGIGFAARY